MYSASRETETALPGALRSIAEGEEKSNKIHVKYLIFPVSYDMLKSMRKEGQPMNFGTISPAICWLIAMLVLLGVEAAVPGLISIWFALGAFAALISAMFHAPLWLQLVWFVVVSLLSLALTRPLAQKYVNGRTTPTNADMVIGRDAVVTEEIDNLHARGAVLLDGKTWTARMAKEEDTAPVGEAVRVLRIEGVKLIVEHR